ncbi:hypothetical protein ACLOJK_037933 [Asimina triloba]
MAETMPSYPIPSAPNHYCGMSAPLSSSPIPIAPDQCRGTTALFPDSDRTHRLEVFLDFDRHLFIGVCSH